jgi:uncharacterized protein YbcI
MRARLVAVSSPDAATTLPGAARSGSLPVLSDDRHRLRRLHKSSMSAIRAWATMSSIRTRLITDSQQSPTTHHEISLEISNEMVQLYKRVFGRGPGRASTHFAGPNTIICTLEGSFTPAERAMAELGEHQRLRETRLMFQHAREGDFRETVERITGRRVRAFISGTDTIEDVSCEVFYLEPDGDAATGAADVVEE